MGLFYRIEGKLEYTQEKKMTSLIIPRMKKTISDIMDDELYEVPESPIQAQGGRSDSPKPYLKRTVSNAGNNGNSIAGNQMYGSMNGSGNNLSSLLNIPDTFIDQYNRLNSTVNNGAGAGNGMGAGAGGEDYTMVPQAYNDEWYGGGNDVNPFTDYGNPDSLSTQQQMHSFIQPQDLTRRRRITTLDDETMSHQKPLKDEDQFLYNPDIQPSQLITNKNFLNEDYLYSDSLFIPNQAEGATNGISMGDYENNFMDGFDEEVEEELSDDDDDNYFYDDFDDSTNHTHNEYFDASTSASTPKSDMMGGYIDDFGVNSIAERDDDDMMIDDVNMEPSSDRIIEQLEDNKPLHNSVESSVEPYNELYNETTGDSSNDNTAEPYTDPSSPSEHHDIKHDMHKTAAEISANNPNHQCDLINPSTGQPCNKQFSRPYDLIRHQETIHATKKKIFRCVICEGRLRGGAGNGKLKTFSRGDALSRHIKVKHGLVGKDALDLINEAKENVEYIYV